MQGESPKGLKCSGEASAQHSFNWLKSSPRDETIEDLLAPSLEEPVTVIDCLQSVEQDSCRSRLYWGCTRYCHGSGAIVECSRV
jgi:hypothetical protein